MGDSWLARVLRPQLAEESRKKAARKHVISYGSTCGITPRCIHRRPNQDILGKNRHRSPEPSLFGGGYPASFAQAVSADTLLERLIFVGFLAYDQVGQLREATSTHRQVDPRMQPCGFIRSNLSKGHWRKIQRSRGTHRVVSCNAEPVGAVGVGPRGN